MPTKQPDWETKEFAALCDALLTCKNRKECSAFLRDVCTFTELKAMSERWQVAQLVNKGIPYRKINEMTGVSTATITRVAHWLRHGEGGYSAALKKQKK